MFPVRANTLNRVNIDAIGITYRGFWFFATSFFYKLSGFGGLIDGLFSLNFAIWQGEVGFGNRGNCIKRSKE